MFVFMPMNQSEARFPKIHTMNQFDLFLKTNMMMLSKIRVIGPLTQVSHNVLVSSVDRPDPLYYQYSSTRQWHCYRSLRSSPHAGYSCNCGILQQRPKIIRMRCLLLGWSFVCLFVCGFSFHSRIFHAYGDTPQS